MFKSLSISAAFCLFLLTAGFNCAHDIVEKSRFDALPICSAQLKQNETKAKLAQCPPLSPVSNLSYPADCCQYWRGFNCEKDILYLIPECQSSRFLIEMQVNLNKPAGTCVEPPADYCANVTNNRVITTVTEDLFRPLTDIFSNATKFQNAENCTDDIKDGIAHCLLHFDGLLDGRLNHTDAAICCDELDFKDCAKNLTESQANCLPFKSDFDSVYAMMEKSIAKKCPAMGSHCYRSGSANVSVTSPIFNFLLIVAFLFGVSN